MKKLSLIPNAISSWRIAVLPFFFYLYESGNVILCLILFASAVFTDLLDGYVARRLEVTSRFGAYFDTATDYSLVIGIFTFFAIKGFYPIWFLLLITASFIIFLVSSFLGKKIYDPIGRYIGSALYIGVVITLVFPIQAAFSFVQYAFIVFFLISLISRIVSFARKRN